MALTYDEKINILNSYSKLRKGTTKPDKINYYHCSTMNRRKYIQKGILKWRETEADSSYEREIYLGEGNTCLFDITYEEAQKILSSWGYKEVFDELLNDMIEDETQGI